MVVGLTRKAEEGKVEHLRCKSDLVRAQRRQGDLDRRHREAKSELEVRERELGEAEEAYEEAKRRGLEIVYPLTTEPWGLRRFFVRAPDGNVININDHKDE